MLKKLKFLLVLAAVFAVAGCKAEVTEEEEDVVAETPKYTITYDAAGHGGTAPEAKTVEEGYKLTEKDLPSLTETGFDFDGWILNEAKIEPGYTVTADITLKAKWTEWETVSTPTFTVAADTVDLADTVAIETTTPDAKIYYTTDGTEPTEQSTPYTTTITIDDSVSTDNVCTIKAIAVKSGMKTSEAVAKTYTIKTYKVKYTIPTNADKVLVKPEDTIYRKGETVTLKTFDEMNAAGTIAADYVFAGWYKENDFTGKKVRTLTITDPQDIELYGMCVYGCFIPKNYEVLLQYYEDKTDGLYTFVFGSNVDSLYIHNSSKDNLKFCLDFSEIKNSVYIGCKDYHDIIMDETELYNVINKIIFPPNCTINKIRFSKFKIEEVIFSGEVTIENDAFKSCENLKKVVFEGNNVILGNDVFSYCENLEKVVFEGKNATFGKKVFMNCTKLTDVTLPENLTAIPERMFSFCELLQSITLPKTVTEIGAFAFENCTSLNTIDLSNVTKMGEAAFYDCAFTEITLPNCIEEIGPSAFQRCKKLQTVKMPDNLEIIPASMFQSCTALENVTIPSTVKEIGKYAFEYCSSKKFTDISIPASVEYIGSCAFCYCDNLSKIIFEAPNNWYYTSGKDREENAKNKTGGTPIPTEIKLNELTTKEAVAAFNTFCETGDGTYPYAFYKKKQ